MRYLQPELSPSTTFVLGCGEMGPAVGQQCLVRRLIWGFGRWWGTLRSDGAH